MRAILALVLILAATRARADDHHPAPSIPWILAQAVPSPQIAFTRGSSTFGLRWQVTPYLYSWGVHHNAPRRFRLFVVEPSMRHAGSFEFFGGPEWFADRRWLGRAGARSYFPIVDRGEALAMSIATSVWTSKHRFGPSLELGVHFLFGMLGVTLAHSPTLERAEWIATVHVRLM